MNVHEYQAKEILESYGIPVPRGGVADTPAEARRIAIELGGRVVVKAQVHAGGRGKAGGVKLVDSAAAAEIAAAGMLGRNLVTHQTGPAGVPVRKVLIAEAMDIADELYLGIVMDSDAGVPMVMASSEGGVEIEEVAATSPGKIVRAAGDPLIGLTPYRARDIAYRIGIPADLVRPATALISTLFRIFVEKDCSLVEINPLVVTGDGRLVALDAKLGFEDDALFRHPEVRALADPEQQDGLERRAAAAGLSYVKLEGGRVGCMVNGAGLAMATMDITTTVGADPANFLDVGGGADEDQISEAFQIIVADDDVRVMLINLFGGILRCDAAARGIVSGARRAGATLPIVVAMR
ncbi:MAG: ADP-forming succinate--CoA ligase subunit beta, partial [Dehalococcoidia bacterium]